MLGPGLARPLGGGHEAGEHIGGEAVELEPDIERHQVARRRHDAHAERGEQDQRRIFGAHAAAEKARRDHTADEAGGVDQQLRETAERSEEHTSELQSLMRISYAVFCLKKKTTEIYNTK